jgi:hypothetical protein
LFAAAVVWVIVVVAGGFCVWWGFLGGPADDKGIDPTPVSTEIAVLTPATDYVSDPQVTPASPPAVLPSDEVFGYGIAADALLLPDYTMGQVEGLGLGWVKQQVRWGDFSPGPGQMDWSGYDAVVEEANRRGLRLMLSVVDAPEWSHTSYVDDTPQGAPPDDFALFSDFLGQLVDRYRGRVHAIEVWNEQNLDREWDTAEGVNPERYVEMLRMAYQSIKSRDPNIIVISGALSPAAGPWVDPNNPNRITVMDDFEYLERSIAAGMLDVCDCVGAHHNGINIPPDVYCDGSYQDPTAVFRGYWDPPQPPHHSWCFRTTLEGYHDRIVAAGSNRPLCVTEFGWASSEGLNGYPPGFEFAQDITLQEQADYIVQAYQMMRNWGFVRLAFLWNLDYANKGPRTPDDPNAPYSILDYNGVARPAFDAVGAMDKP